MMIRKFGLLMVLTAIYPLGSSAVGIADIVTGLTDSKCVNASVTYSVTLPQTDTDVVYDITFSTTSTSGTDPLSPCDYLISWKLPTPSGLSEGFSAYYDGHHYRYRDSRLQEYHLEWDSVPFLLDGGRKGVQSQAQFTDLLPARIAAEIASSADDPAYSYSAVEETTFSGRKALRLRVTRETAGVTSMERTYTFDAATMLPLRIDTENNPGSITEQSILADYTYPEEYEKCSPVTEQALMDRFPEIFEKYRQSNFRIENLPGSPLPAFSLKGIDGSRFTYGKDSPLAAPTVIAFLEPETGFTPQVIAAVREAIDNLPYSATVLWAFSGNNQDQIAEIIPSVRTGESVLTGARSLARDCGVSSWPVVVMADSSGIVKKVALGFNNNLSDVVLQNMALIQ